MPDMGLNGIDPNLLAQLKMPAGLGGGLPDLMSMGIPGLGGSNLQAGSLGLPMMQNPLLGLGMNMPPQQSYQRPQAQSSGMLIPGSQQHALAFHAKGPDYEIKLFVGGLAFQTSGMYFE